LNFRFSISNFRFAIRKVMIQKRQSQTP